MNKFPPIKQPGWSQKFLAILILILPKSHPLISKKYPPIKQPAPQKRKKNGNKELYLRTVKLITF